MQRLSSHFAKSLKRLKVPKDEADKVAIAFSGGPDSTALAALTAQWHYSENTSKGPPQAFIVDHKLRPHSTDEAHHAANLARSLGLYATVLTVDWQGNPPEKHQKLHAARNARYSLLVQACYLSGIKHLFTAHHANDQAETFLLRLIHASGLDGLSSIPPINNHYEASHGVRLLRPLLGMHKVDLVHMCNELNVNYVMDETNNDPGFLRNRLRQLITSTEAAVVSAYDEQYNDDVGSEYYNNNSSSSSSPAYHHHHHHHHHSNNYNSITMTSTIYSQQQHTTNEEHHHSLRGYHHNSINTIINTTTTTTTNNNNNNMDTNTIIPYSSDASLVEDILRLQRICSKVSNMQQRQASALLRRVTMRASPMTGLEISSRRSSSLMQHQQQVNNNNTSDNSSSYNNNSTTNADHNTNNTNTNHNNTNNNQIPLFDDNMYDVYNSRRRWVHWPSQLAVLSRSLVSIPHAIIQTGHFASADGTVAAVALSKVLQAVSQSEYPPSLSDCIKLADRLRYGCFQGGFTGGGCTIHPVVRSRGRYALILPQKVHAQAMELLRKQQQESTSGGGGGGGDNRRYARGGGGVNGNSNNNNNNKKKKRRGSGSTDNSSNNNSNASDDERDRLLIEMKEASG